MILNANISDAKPLFLVEAVCQWTTFIVKSLKFCNRIFVFFESEIEDLNCLRLALKLRHLWWLATSGAVRRIEQLNVVALWEWCCCPIKVMFSPYAVRDLDYATVFLGKVMRYKQRFSKWNSLITAQKIGLYKYLWPAVEKNTTTSDQRSKEWR